MTSNFLTKSELRANERKAERLLEDIIKKHMSIEKVQGMIDKPMAGPQRPKKKAYVKRDRVVANERLMADYFNRNPVYKEIYFRLRFRMPKDVFLRILHALEQHDEYFRDRMDCCGEVSLSPYQKCTAAIRQLCYGTAADSLGEYLKIGESTSLEYVIRFCRGVITLFGPTYLRKPTTSDMKHILNVNEGFGFPGMLGSLGCMHWQWKNCPAALRGAHARSDHLNKPTVVLEAVATKDLWIWHVFFGMAGSNNDLTVLNHSSLFTDVVNEWQPPVKYTVNGNEYTLPYYLVDDIYPSWPVFVKTILLAQFPKHKKFTEFQEGCRKDVERAFGCLQSHFHIITRPSRMWMPESLGLVMNACVIMHNMIVEVDSHNYDVYIEQEDEGGPRERTWRQGSFVLNDVIVANTAMMQDRRAHTALKEDLIEHIWNRYGE